MIIKSSIGKLSMTKPYAKFIKNQRLINNILTLELAEDDLAFLENLPNIHADPFDRILICQAMANNMAIITPDKHIKSYPVNVLW